MGRTPPCAARLATMRGLRNSPSLGRSAFDTDTVSPSFCWIASQVPLKRGSAMTGVTVWYVLPLASTVLQPTGTTFISPHGTVSSFCTTTTVAFFAAFFFGFSSSSSDATPLSSLPLSDETVTILGFSSLSSSLASGFSAAFSSLSASLPSFLDGVAPTLWWYSVVLVIVCLYFTVCPPCAATFAPSGVV